MRLKWYLRGIGIGVIVTAVLLHFCTVSSSAMNDEEIRARALELGMIENATLSALSSNEIHEIQEVNVDDNLNNDDSDKDDESVSDNDSVSEDAVAASPSPTATATASPLPTVAPTATPTVAPTVAPTASPSPSAQEASQGANVTIRVVGGENSYTVAQKCQQAGLVDSATKFDQFLCQNGYATTLRVGNHVIPAGASQEQIAKILTGKNN